MGIVDLAFTIGIIVYLYNSSRWFFIENFDENIVSKISTIIGILFFIAIYMNWLHIVISSIIYTCMMFLFVFVIVAMLLLAYGVKYGKLAKDIDMIVEKKSGEYIRKCFGGNLNFYILYTSVVSILQCISWNIIFWMS